MNDKLVLGFVADILYIKGIICLDEFEAIGDVTDATQLNDIVDRMLKDDFNKFKRGEAYVGYGK